MWKIVDDYLRVLAVALHVDRVELKLYRSQLAGPLEITEKNADHGYLKPDIGYGARLESYFVQLVNPYHGGTVTSWSLYEFPSCCAFCVSTRAEVLAYYRRVGVNTISNKFRQELAKEAGYSALICTDILANDAERKTLAKNGFKDIYQIKNKRTGNQVAISVKEL